jgi:hypothetical protein
MAGRLLVLTARAEGVRPHRPSARRLKTRGKLAPGQAMAILQDALQAKYSVLSSVGPHAGDDWPTIVDRKREDIAKAKHSIWVVNSNATRPEALRAFCTKHDARYVVFVSRRPGGNANAGPPTAHRAQHYSADGKTWERIDPAFCSVSRGQRRLGEKEYRAPSVTPGLHFAPELRPWTLAASARRETVRY